MKLLQALVNQGLARQEDVDELAAPPPKTDRWSSLADKMPNVDNGCYVRPGEKTETASESRAYELQSGNGMMNRTSTEETTINHLSKNTAIPKFDRNSGGFAAWWSMAELIISRKRLSEGGVIEVILSKMSADVMKHTQKSPAIKNGSLTELIKEMKLLYPPDKTPDDALTEFDGAHQNENEMADEYHTRLHALCITMNEADMPREGMAAAIYRRMRSTMRPRYMTEFKRDRAFNRNAPTMTFTDFMATCRDLEASWKAEASRSCARERFSCRDATVRALRTRRRRWKRMWRWPTRSGHSRPKVLAVHGRGHDARGGSVPRGGAIRWPWRWIVRYSKAVAAT